MHVSDASSKNHTWVLLRCGRLLTPGLLAPVCDKNFDTHSNQTNVEPTEPRFLATLVTLMYKTCLLFMIVYIRHVCLRLAWQGVSRRSWCWVDVAHHQRLLLLRFSNVVIWFLSSSSVYFNQVHWIQSFVNWSEFLSLTWINVNFWSFCSLLFQADPATTSRWQTR